MTRCDQHPTALGIFPLSITFVAAMNNITIAETKRLEKNQNNTNSTAYADAAAA